MAAVVMFGVIDPPPADPHANVRFELVAPGVTGSVLDGHVQVFAPDPVMVDMATGRWEVTVDFPTADPAMLPQGCVMRSTLRAKGRRPAVDVWTVPFGAGAGPFFVGDYLTDPPGALTPSALAAEIARAEGVEADLQDQIDAGTGAVESVNGHTGVVVLGASDVGADPAGAATGAVAGHVAAVDPHGDRAYAAGLVDDLSGVTNAPAARTALGLGSAALLASSAFDAAGAASGAQSGATAAAAAMVDDLSGVTDSATARANLGLGSAATHPVGDFDATGAAAAAQAYAVQRGNHTGTQAESTVTGLVGDLAARAFGLTRTAVKTGNYTAAANELVPIDTTGGTVAVALPSAPADRTRVAVKHILPNPLVNAGSVVCSGTDVFNRAGGSTTLTITTALQGWWSQYDAATGVWTAQDSLALGSLDLRYDPAGAAAAVAANPTLAILAAMNFR